VRDYVRNHGTKPRFKGNRLIFVAADAGAVTRMRDAVRTALAWASIVKDIAEGRLNVDRLREGQAKKEAESANAVATRAVRDAYKWLLCPTMHAATDRDIQVEVFPLNAGAGSMTSELERVCEENELVIRTWSPIHLRSLLQKLYWTGEESSVSAMRVWDDSQKYLYLPRLHSRAVFEDVLRRGAETEDFFGVAYGRAGDRYEGFRLGAAGVALDDTLVLIEPGAAKAYREARAKSVPPPKKPSERSMPSVGSVSESEAVSGSSTRPAPEPSRLAAVKAPTRFFGSVDVPAATAKMKLVELATEIIAVLASDPNGSVHVTLEIRGEFPEGAQEHVKRAVSENAAQIGGFRANDWE